MEFQKALNLDPASMEARAGLISVRGEPRHEMRFGQGNDLFNFTSANHDGWLSLLSQWTPHWSTSFAGSFYERAGIRAGKFSGGITGRMSRWGALTVGGAAGHDNAVIPKSEAFFDVNHGWKASETNFLRGVEFDYGRSEEHTSELQSPCNLVCRLLLEKKKTKTRQPTPLPYIRKGV